MNNFRTYDLALEFHKKVIKLRLPKYLAHQLNRAAASIVCNLMEGSGRRTWLDKRKFYYMALGSQRECLAVLDMAEIYDAKLRDLLDHIGASLYKLCHCK